MTGKIVVIALNIPKGCDEYDRLNGMQKIELLKANIANICEELNESDPNAIWIIAWREYGITEGPGERSISSETKKFLKQEMQAFVKQYPNLRIVAGTVATRSNKSLRKANEHFLLYSEKNIARIVAEKEQEDDDVEFSNHVARFEKILKNKELKPEEKPIQIIRNTCYIFTPEGVQRKEKNAPLQELAEDKNVDTFTAYRVGKENKSINPIIIIHDGKGESVALGIEICREHSFGFLKNYVEDKKASIPLIHLVESDSIKLSSENFCGYYVIQLDSVFSPKLIIPNPLIISKSFPEVMLYSTDLSLKKQKKETLVSVPVLYPFECQVLNLFDQCISKISGKHNPRKLHLEQIKKLFYPIAGFGYDHYMVEFLEKMFRPQPIYFINSDQDRLSFDKIHREAKVYLCFILHKNKIYHIDNEKKSFNPLDDKYKPALIKYFSSGYPIKIEANEKNILAIEALTGYKTNKLIKFLNESYWWNHNPIVIFRDNINQLLREHIKQIGNAIKDVARKSDLGQSHAFLLSDDKEDVIRVEQKNSSSHSSSLSPSSKSAQTPSKEEASNDSEFLEEQFASKRKSPSS